MRRSAFLAVACAALLVCAGCGRPEKPVITVGAKSEVEDTVLGEIVAQHLEKRLGVTVVRVFDAGSTAMGVQGLMMANFDVYPEDTNWALVDVLKELVPPDPIATLLRVRGELARTARIQVLEPLGIHRRFTIVTRAAEAEKRNVKTLSAAAAQNPGWMLGSLSDFQSRVDGYSAMMNAYSLRQEISPRIMKPAEVYLGLASGQVDLASGFNTDGQLGDPQFVELEDDKKVFIEGLTCLLVRNESLDRNPGLKAALDELSSRFDNERMRKMNAEVVLKKRKAADVAKEFLSKAGLRP